MLNTPFRATIFLLILSYVIYFLIIYIWGFSGPDISTNLIILFWILANLLDIHSTFKVIKASSIDNEGNLIARVFLRKFGLLKGLFIFKICFGVPLTLIGLLSPRTLLFGATILTNFVVIRNYHIFYNKIK